MSNNNLPVNTTSATEESFWSLLGSKENAFDIYIPRIQRDYAQGRTDEATTQIREKFVEDLFSSIINYESTGESLDINFIYGNIEEDTGSRRFIPIDGQQRLTTLFLLHWYFALFSGKIDSDPEVRTKLLQFQYETRNVTGQFCRNLTERVRIDLKNYDPKKKLSDAIRNYYWFFSDFEHDASIKAMLVMIDAIHEKAKEYISKGVELDDAFDILTENPSPIRFLYLNLDDAGLTDSIYIKMNARGKALTHFENFKALLRNYLAENEEFADQFINNINGKWAEFFWTPEYRKVKKDTLTGNEIRESSFDSQIMKFFRFMMYTDYIVNVDEEAVKNNQGAIRDSLTLLNREQDYVFTSRLFKDNFKNVYSINSSKEVLSVDTFRKINKLLNVLTKRQKETGSIEFTDTSVLGKSFFDEANLFTRLIGTSKERNPVNEEQILLFAEYAFLIKYSNEDYSFNKEAELNHWLRLVSNLVKPNLNLQLDVFYTMIRSVSKMVENGYALDCDKYMGSLLRRNYRQSLMSVFTETQVIEESIKSILSMRSEAWKEIIIKSEISFMEGQTGALFAFSGLTDEYLRQIAEFEATDKEASFLPEDNTILAGIDESSEYYKSFETYLTKFNLLFDRSGLRTELEDKAIFRRALLCYGGKYSYMLPPWKSRQSFLDNTDRDYSFRRLLRDENEGKRNYLKMLMDDICIDELIPEQLQSIIDNAEFGEDARWKYFFVKIPEILDCIEKDPSKKDPQGEWIFAIPQRFIRRNSNDDILLLSRSQTNSINRELYSYVLFLKARKENLNVKYYAFYTDNAEKYAYYESKNNGKVSIVYKKKDDIGYVYIARTEDETELIYYESMEGMLDYIKKTIK